MHTPDTHDAPLVPNAPTDTEDRTARADGGSRRSGRPFARPPETEHTTEYARGAAEIEPLVADLR